MRSVSEKLLQDTPQVTWKASQPVDAVSARTRFAVWLALGQCHSLWLQTK